tara:strand:+ start:10040 stop:10195 length:156 start_codon:yes stop_codon:yes gene_type:complete
MGEFVPIESNTALNSVFHDIFFKILLIFNFLQICKNFVTNLAEMLKLFFIL